MAVGDFELARRVLAGDESAAEELFEEFFPRLYRFARLRLDSDDEAAEEVVQKTMILAVRKLYTYRGEAALFTWLCTLCRREIGGWLEARGRAGGVSVPEDSPAARQALDTAARMSSTDPESEAQRHELSRLVHLTLDHLPARYSQVLEWKYIEGLPVDEIADRLGIGYKAAESLLSRARPAFREAFALLTAAWPNAVPGAGSGEAS
jgi:RNA polymerase sigma-70 factor, ECF subfamily